MKPSVYLTRKLPDQLMEQLAQQVELTFYDEADQPVPRAELLRGVEGVDGIFCLLTDKIDGEVLDRAGKQLKVISNLAVGYDNIDAAEAKKRGIFVTNTPGVLTETTADLTFALLMATARRIVEAEDNLRRGGWKTWSPMQLTGLDIYGATLGLIGMGRIGEAVAKRAKGFDMNVIYYNRNRKPEAEQQFGCQYKSKDEVVQEADFLVVLTPLTPETQGILGARELNMMKKTAILIKTARGSVVDEEALYEALKERKIWAAGVDVFAKEPIDPNHPLLSLDNAVLLPHIGSASIDTRTKMCQMAIRNVVAGVTGQTPPNCV
ncbi:MAG: ghrB 1 [Bacilli bacterium]|nr:ghrB 1 [Bacilli bacterium]